MNIPVCDLCGQDIHGGYATWVEVPLNIDNPRIANTKHPNGQDTAIVHLQVVNGREDFDLCAACFRDAMRRYIEATTTTPNKEERCSCWPVPNSDNFMISKKCPVHGKLA